MKKTINAAIIIMTTLGVVLSLYVLFEIKKANSIIILEESKKSNNGLELYSVKFKYGNPYYDYRIENGVMYRVYPDGKEKEMVEK